MIDSSFGWIVIAFSLLAAWICIANGRVRFNAFWYVERAEKPFIFWLAICAPVLVGIAIVVQGLR